ncbi:MAG: SDR family NAD(P)-dependent oxidoreductase [Firmicutes bacterium]|nr:SDR family NAD(P)-dependent oxidoreductase [Bacillota bacterium]
MRIVATGLSGGIGEAVKLRLGARPEVELVALSRHPDEARARWCDVTWEPEKIQRALEGVGVIDALLLLHGADILSPPLSEQSYQERLDALYRVDVAGSIKVVKAALAHLAPGAAIVLMGWDQADTGAAGEASELYATAKAALVGFAKSLATTLLGRASVYVVAPGWVLTRWARTLSEERRERIRARTRAGRWLEPDEVAAVIEAAIALPPGVMTGHVFYVNHGDVMPS